MVQNQGDSMIIGEFAESFKDCKLIRTFAGGTALSKHFVPERVNAAGKAHFSSYMVDVSSSGDGFEPAEGYLR